MHIGDAIRQLRTTQGLSQAQLATMASYPKANLSRLEKTGGNPRYLTLQRFAEALGVPTSSLIALASDHSDHRDHTDGERQ